MATSGFPNMFMILGPNGPFTNLPPSIETQVDWIGEAIGHVSGTDAGWIDVDPQTESDWTDTCAQIADQTLFPKAASWIFGANIPGKKRTVMFYLGGIKQYRSILAAVSAAEYPGFTNSDDILEGPQRDDQRRNCRPDDGQRSRRRSPRPAQPHRDHTGRARRAGPQDRHGVLHL